MDSSTAMFSAAVVPTCSLSWTAAAPAARVHSCARSGPSAHGQPAPRRQPVARESTGKLSWAASTVFAADGGPRIRETARVSDCALLAAAAAGHATASSSGSAAGGAVVTGSTKGIGLALARELLRSGVDVVITGRDQVRVDEVVRMLSGEAGARGRAFGLAGDVSKYEDMERLAEFAKEKLGTLGFWINNAGTNGYRLSPLDEFPPEKIREVVESNTIGLLYGCRAALRVMKAQGSGHIFNMIGAGAAGDATPTYAVYGATKRAIPQLTKSLVKESAGGPVGVHNLQPGMVLTDLLLSGTSVTARRFFNVLAETPANVAADLVPKILGVSGTGRSVSFLTPGRILFRFGTFWARRGRFFDDQGEPVGEWVKDGEFRTSPLGVPGSASRG